MHTKKRIPLKAVTCLIIIAVATVIVSLLAAPALSASSNPCSPCHSTYNQQLDIVEGSGQNQIPTTIQVGQTQTVTVVIQNINNVARYTQLTGVSLTLSSQSNHFTVSNPTYSVGTLATGTATASWQITGTSAGSDALVISASARNTHENRQFSDSYAPNPTLTVTAASTATPVPTSAPTPIATPNATPTASPTSTANPTTNPLATPSAPTVTPTATPIPTHSPDPTATQTTQPTSAPTPTNIAPSNTPTPTPQADHELNSIMLYIHPPLAIVGFALVFLFTALMFKNSAGTSFTKYVGLSLWIFTFLGLLTGMVWAQWAWGSYWSWDPKETITLTLFLTVSAAQVAYLEKRYSAAKWVALLACVLTVATGLSSYIIVGLHSFA